MYEEQKWGTYPSEHLIRFIALNFYNKVRNETNILEVGCGAGNNIWYLAREGFNSYGIDINEKSISNAKIGLSKENLNSDLIVGDISNLPYSDSFFNCIIDNECLYFNNFETTKVILNEIKRTLKKDGLFFSRTFSNNTYLGKNNEKISDYEYKNISDGILKDKGFVRILDYEEIKKLYGLFFEIISIEKIEYTRENQSYLVSEWVIICKKP